MTDENQENLKHALISSVLYDLAKKHRRASSSWNFLLLLGLLSWKKILLKGLIIKESERAGHHFSSVSSRYSPCYVGGFKLVSKNLLSNII